ncbi:uncharacterized protein EV422DRAFT_616320 [Fimicolochytrium jonesii]|uniref:uncharacterized protein n=1 Tax=Fimicolochytrium jonesii TaxID=1396493 RepID=UPI0022FF3562|nr:uncharacterized protein EV422DRAFT_616320 [Fimicolochytrium jonesii]KAI8826910.1 hypothetical protein EV422DRAFT_616320 [Fimicolochytrium jonesii]
MGFGFFKSKKDATGGGNRSSSSSSNRRTRSPSPLSFSTPATRGGFGHKYPAAPGSPVDSAFSSTGSSSSKSNSSTGYRTLDPKADYFDLAGVGAALPGGEGGRGVSGLSKATTLDAPSFLDDLVFDFDGRSGVKDKKSPHTTREVSSSGRQRDLEPVVEGNEGRSRGEPPARRRYSFEKGDDLTVTALADRAVTTPEAIRSTRSEPERPSSGSSVTTKTKGLKSKAADLLKMNTNQNALSSHTVPTSTTPQTSKSSVTAPKRRKSRRDAARAPSQSRNRYQNAHQSSGTESDSDDDVALVRHVVSNPNMSAAFSRANLNAPAAPPQRLRPQASSPNLRGMVQPYNSSSSSSSHDRHPSTSTISQSSSTASPPGSPRLAPSASNRSLSRTGKHPLSRSSSRRTNASTSDESDDEEAPLSSVRHQAISDAQQRGRRRRGGAAATPAIVTAGTGRVSTDSQFSARSNASSATLAGASPRRKNGDPGLPPPPMDKVMPALTPHLQQHAHYPSPYPQQPPQPTQYYPQQQLQQMPAHASPSYTPQQQAMAVAQQQQMWNAYFQQAAAMQQAVFVQQQQQQQQMHQRAMLGIATADGGAGKERSGRRGRK